MLIEHVLHKLVGVRLFVMVHEHHAEIAGIELLARCVRQVSCQQSVALLLTCDSKHVSLAAVDWFAQIEFEEILFLVSEANAC